MKKWISVILAAALLCASFDRVPAMATPPLNTMMLLPNTAMLL